MTDYVSLGSTPYNEECAQIGDPDYYKKTKEELKKYKSLILTKYGEPPEGARLQVKSFSHDFGSYHELCVVYELDNIDAENYAFALEQNCPETWKDDEFVDWKSLCDSYTEQGEEDENL